MGRRTTRPRQPPPTDDATFLPHLMALDLSPDRPVLASHHLRPERDHAGADMHHALEFGVVITGCMHRHHGAGWFRVGVGQAWATAPLEIHRWIRPRGMQYVSFQVLPHILGQLPTVAGFDPSAPFRSPARLHAIGTGRCLRRDLADLARQLAIHPDHRPSMGAVLVDMVRLLQPVSAAVDTSADPRPAHPGAPARSSVEPAVQRVQQQPGRIVAVDEAAHACHMARRTFCRTFRSAMGISFGEFALRWRLACAANVLRSTQVPIKAIAHGFGFNGPSHFHQAFSTRYRMSPTQYRGAAAPSPA